MPSRLRPTASYATEAILVGDPGRALLLAQELLVEPKMSNHARGLWGYWGKTPQGRELTIQSTGMGAPSALLVLGDLAELGLCRAVRIGTCAGFEGDGLGQLLVVGEAVARGGSATAVGLAVGESAAPAPRLSERLSGELGEHGRAALIASFDTSPPEDAPRAVSGADMQTAPLLAGAGALGIELAAVLIVAERAGFAETLARDELEQAEKRAGRAASASLSG